MLMMLLWIELNPIKTSSTTYFLWFWFGQNFLDEASFPSEDKLNDFEFGQAYTTGWCWLRWSWPCAGTRLACNHKCMTSDQDFFYWAPAWWTHYYLLHAHLSFFLLFFLTHLTWFTNAVSCCKLNQVLLAHIDHHMTICTQLCVLSDSQCHKSTPFLHPLDTCLTPKSPAIFS